MCVRLYYALFGLISWRLLNVCMLLVFLYFQIIYLTLESVTCCKRGYNHQEIAGIEVCFCFRKFHDTLEMTFACTSIILVERRIYSDLFAMIAQLYIKLSPYTLVLNFFFVLDDWNFNNNVHCTTNIYNLIT